MSSKYQVELISIQEKDALMREYGERLLYEERADIYGCCIKLLTDNKYIKERWEENFYPMSAYVRSHGRLIVTQENSERQRVLYDPLSKTAFLVNMDYYGWVKSIALSVAGDVLEDEHSINSVHGACVDLNGRGVCLIAPSGTGKTTHTYGLIRLKGVRVISDDWFYVRFMADQDVAFSSEKNFYIQADIAEIWGEYKKLVEKAEFDAKDRAIVDIRWIVGKGKIFPMTTLNTAILLKRDPEDSTVVRKLAPNEAVEYMKNVGFCNPHLLVTDSRKTQLREKFFQEFFSRLETYLVNTTPPPLDTHQAIKEILKVNQ
ncbi:MAG: aldolase [Candidatus Bathyarchaeota archaeon]|nr:aldolase [Candidatus Bathyarchaeota archaeon]